MSILTSPGRSRGARLALAAAALVLLALAARSLDVGHALAWIEGAGAGGPVAFVAFYVAACVLFLPGSVLTLAAGALFGLPRGSVIASIAATLGATAAFLVGRYLLRDWVAAKVADDERFAAIDKAVADEGWKIVGLLRLSPVFPFNLLNYAFGLTRVRLRDYVLASCVGMLPGTVTYVYLGSIAGDLARLGGGRAERTTLEWALYAVGLAATIAATVIITRIARRALDRRIPGEGTR